jgi:hypothetical protein
MTFILALFIAIHIVACLWVMTVQFSNGGTSANYEGTWMEDNEMSNSELYLTSFYYTVTTITTVGYGDVSIVSKTERFFCIALMICGCIAFAFSSGTLASIFQ